MEMNINTNTLTLIVCRNFNEDQISRLLNDQMRVNPLIFHEVLMSGSLDKYHDFNEDTMFFNFVVGID